MSSHFFKVLLGIFFVVLGCSRNEAQKPSNDIPQFNTLSEHFLREIKAGKDTKVFQDQLAYTTLEALEEGLQTDKQKLAFWVNIYNAYIQVLLSEKPELYDDRQAFFNEERILIAGKKRSLSKIEHGIIRKSQWPLGLGKIRKWFTNKFERKLRVDQPDYRIHFALNCGAKDCPPVAIYEVSRLNDQFDASTRNYLKKTTKYNDKTETVAASSLFSWFRGDFNGKSGIKKILREQGLIPKEDVQIEFKNYDWTMELDNWIEF
jgi:hypothetical protein